MERGFQSSRQKETAPMWLPTGQSQTLDPFQFSEVVNELSTFFVFLFLTINKHCRADIHWVYLFPKRNLSHITVNLRVHTHIHVYASTHASVCMCVHVEAETNMEGFPHALCTFLVRGEHELHPTLQQIMQSSGVQLISCTLENHLFDLSSSPTRSVSILFKSMYISSLLSPSIKVQGCADMPQHTHESLRVTCRSCFSSTI